MTNYRKAIVRFYKLLAKSTDLKEKSRAWMNNKSEIEREFVYLIKNLNRASRVDANSLFILAEFANILDKLKNKKIISYLTKS